MSSNLRERHEAFGLPDQEPSGAVPSRRVQFRRQLAGLDYQSQLDAVRPPPLGRTAAVQASGPLGAVQFNGGKPYEGSPGEEIDPSTVPVYRGGSSLDVKPNEFKVDNSTGKVKTTHGMSLDTDEAQMAKFGGAHRVKSVPAKLKIIQRGGRKTHFEIVPRDESLTPEEYKTLVSQVVLE